MNDAVKKEFNILVNDYGNTAEFIDKIIEYDDCYMLKDKSTPNSLNGESQLVINKDGSSELINYYAILANKPIIKEYSFEEFERLCS